MKMLKKILIILVISIVMPLKVITGGIAMTLRLHSSMRSQETTGLSKNA